ncbi:MAG: lysophospholipid acyltransferase family protein [Phaeodactylibacter sp.]|nr:lysophospholipid acyltransferase family protein [Phaeodactylibacter sp.]
MMSRFSQFILKLFGWKTEGNVPRDLKKYLIVVVPHTSNWDFLLGILVRSALRLDRVRFIGKSSLFKFPYGFIFRALGGYPVDRKKSSGYVESVIDIFQREDEFATTIAPEGTRGKVDRLKSGFYYIADGAKVPMILTRFDFGTKTVTLREPFYTTGDMEADMARINDYFRGAVGRNPQKGYLYGE